MGRLTKTIFCFFVLSQAVWAGTPQLFTAGLSTTSINTGAVQYYNIQTSGGGSTTEAARRSVAPSSGAFHRLKCCLTVDPAGGAGVQSVTFATRIAGATGATSVTISEGDADLCADTTTASTYAAGDALAIIETPANTPTASNFSCWLWGVDDTKDKTIYLGSTEANNLSNSATNYGSFSPGTSPGATENLMQIPMPFAGTIVGFYGLLSGTPGTGNNYAFAVYKNGSSTGAPTFTISDSETSDSDTTTTLAFNAGDTLSWESIPTSTPTARQAAIAIAVTNSVGGFAILGGQATDLGFDTAGTVFHPFGPFSYSATETDRQQRFSRQIQLRAIYADTFAAPGAGTSYTITVRDDAADTNCSLSVADAATSASDTCEDNVIEDSQMSVEITAANTPTDTGGWFSVHAYARPENGFLVH